LYDKRTCRRHNNYHLPAGYFATQNYGRTRIGKSPFHFNSCRGGFVTIYLGLNKNQSFSARLFWLAQQKILTKQYAAEKYLQSVFNHFSRMHYFS